MLELIDALRDVLRDGLGIAVDESGERPYDWTPETLYVWEESSAWTSIGTGEKREDFVVMAAIAEATGEEAAGQRSRETTVALYGYRDAFLEAIRTHANTGPWADGNIEGASVPAYLRQLDVRGVAVRISGYRLIG